MRYFSLLIICCFAGLNTLYGQYFGVTQPITGKWAAGIQLGSNYMLGDVRPAIPGYQTGLYVQNSVSRFVDVKIQLSGGTSSGLALTPTQGFQFNSALNGDLDSLHFYDSSQQVFHNFSTQYGSLSGLAKININRLIASNGGEIWDVYLMLGLGLFLNNTYINVYDDAKDVVYDYNSITSTDPVEVRQALQMMLDASYETPAQRDQLNKSFIGEYAISTTLTGGLGMRIRLSDHIAVGLEGQYLIITDDLIDGQQWTDQNTASPDNDHLIQAHLTVDYIF